MPSEDKTHYSGLVLTSNDILVPKNKIFTVPKSCIKLKTKHEIYC